MNAYSETIDAFLSHYYPLMKNAPSPTIVSKQIVEAVKNASMCSQCFFRYTVGEDSKSLAAAKKDMSDFSPTRIHHKKYAWIGYTCITV